MNNVQHHISFVLDDKVVNIDFYEQKISPTLTVLNYLRSLPNHKGVKEGCAEGDCGACTVVIVDLDDSGKLNYKAVNSCLIFMPMVHGKQLITVENLAEKKGREVILHPVQQALVNNNGSQCGYCTPGIIMSMFALYKNFNHPARQIIEEAMVGNLCRCTGYQSILNAVRKADNGDKTDKFSKMEKSIISLLKKIKTTTGSIAVISSGQKYFQPKTLKECLFLRQKYPDAKCANGTTDIALLQTKKFETLAEIIDLSAINELKHFKETRREIIIGAGISLETVKESVKNSLPELFGLLSVFASKQIRNLATLGGNLGTASPISDTIPLLFACNAKLKLMSIKGERIISVEDFIKGYRKTDLQNAEIIYSIIIPRQINHFIRFYKVSKRRDLDISTVNAGFRLKIKNKFVDDICLAYGGMAEMTKRATLTENCLRNKKWSLLNIKSAQKLLEEDFHPISDARSGAEFRSDAAKNLLLRFYEETKGKIKSSR